MLLWLLPTLVVAFRGSVQTRSSVLHASLVDLNETYRPFSGAEDIHYQRSSNGKIYFVPTFLEGATPQQSWKFTQERRLAQTALREAIPRGEESLGPYFEALKPHFATDKCDILEANAEFFRALQERDIEAMSALWEASEASLCVRSLRGEEPSVARGHIAVMRGWVEAMAAAQRSPVTISYADVQLFYFGASALVTCVATTRSGKSKPARALVTQLFERSQATGRYMLVSHVSSSLPADPRAQRGVYMDPGVPKKPSRQPFMSEYLLGGEDGADMSEGPSDGSESVGDSIQAQISNSLRRAVSQFGGITSNVVVMDSRGNSIDLTGGGWSESTKDEEGSGDGQEDDDEEDLGKLLASRTLAAVRWLHKQGRLSTLEKRVLTSDIVKNVGGGKFSEAEVAYSLLVGNGRPDEWEHTIVIDLDHADKDDMIEFADACRSLVRRISLRSQNN